MVMSVQQNEKKKKDNKWRRILLVLLILVVSGVGLGVACYFKWEPMIEAFKYLLVFSGGALVGTITTGTETATFSVPENYNSVAVFVTGENKEWVDKLIQKLTEK